MSQFRLTVENRKKLQLKYVALVNLVKQIETNYLGKDIQLATQAFKKSGFRVVVRKDGVEGVNPYFDPKRVYLYHENSQLCHVYYL